MVFFGLHVGRFFPSYNLMIAPVLSGTMEMEISSGIAIFLEKQNLLLGSSPVLAVLVAVFWTMIYSILATFVLNKKDIC